ncbi:hypothetical protein OEZ85_004692 [Tetradesmus obliquus]|uniref:Uncharacterized protein n=1 Tax=Tetradesmus obliquus TaxID=3088 RepID=A0ABY8UMP8_TETOB|nr:hypothetical protein OEZ85_004692 [Tetradesmus obliquus]
MQQLDGDEGALDCSVDSSWQMPKLQKLRVAEFEGEGFTPQLIARMPQLRWLELNELSTLWVDGSMGPSEMQQLLTLSKLTKLGVGGCDWNDDAAERPLAQLTGLRELTVLAASKLTAGGLACLTALKRLSRLAVWGSKIRFDDNDTHNSRTENPDSDSEELEYQNITLPESESSATAWISSQLQHLTLLRSLDLFLCGRACSSSLPHPPEDSAALGEVIGQLVLLTHLSIPISVDGRALAAASNLRQLQQLELHDIGNREHPAKLQDLPCSSLTYLWLDEGVVDRRIDGSWQLPQLQRLKVAEWHGAGFEPQITARMPQLRVLELSREPNGDNWWGMSDVELSTLWAGSGVGSGEMGHLKTLSKLTKLGVGGCDWNDDAAEEALAQLTGLRELRMTAASKLTAGGLACLTALSRLSYQAVWGSKISLSKNNSKDDNSDSESDSDDKKPEYQDVTLANKGCCQPVYLELRDKCSSSFQGLAMMCKHAQEQAAQTAFELSRKEEALQYHLSHLEAVKRELVDTLQELTAAQQLLQQQGQQLPAQQLQELQELRRMRDAVMSVVQQQHQPPP